MKYVPKGAIYNIPVLVQIMAWRRTNDVPDCQRIYASLGLNGLISPIPWLQVTRAEMSHFYHSWGWITNTYRNSEETISYFVVNSLRPSDAYMSDLTSIGSDNGLSPSRRQAIIITNAGILLIYNP